MRLRHGIGVNLLSRAASVVIGIILLAVYLRILGVEAVGLIGFYGVLSGSTAVIEHVFGIVVMRETAWLSGQADGARRQRDLLRTMEAFYALIASALAIGITLAAPFIARVWLSSSSLSTDTIQTCVMLMAWTLPPQLLFSLHLNALVGLERQLEAGVFAVILTVVRGGAALLVLLTIAGTSEAYFASQLAATAICLALSFRVTWNCMPEGGARARFRRKTLSEPWRYAPSLAANAVLFVLFLQADKLIVTAVLPLESFGYYVLASTVASFPWSIVGPVTMAVLPRFARLLRGHSDEEMRAVFHATSQLVSFALLPPATVALFHPEALVFLWTGDPNAASETRLLVPLLIAGTTLMALSCVPSALQLAAGWPQFILLTNLLGLLAVPLAYVLTVRHGAAGAAAIWLTVGTLHLIVPPLLLHRRILPGEQGRWYLVDLGMPALAAAAVGFAARALATPPETRIGLLLYLAGVWIAACLVVAVVAPDLRREIARFGRVTFDAWRHNHS